MSPSPPQSPPRTARRFRPRFRFRLAALAVPLAVALTAWAAGPNGVAQASAPPPPSGWSQVFLDDFDGAAGSSIDGQWMYDTGSPIS